MSIVILARFIAISIGLLMLVYFLTQPVIRSDNAFLIPDILLTLLLLASAFLPRQLAIPAMLFSFGLAVGIFMVALFTYIVRGEFNLGLCALIMVSSITGVLLGFMITSMAS